ELWGRRERADFNLDLAQMSDGGLRALEYRRNAAGDRDVVILDEHRIVEAEAMVEAAAAADRVFLERAQAGRGFARAADARLGVGDFLHEHGRRRGDAGEVAEEVERDALGRQNRTRRAGDAHERR